MIDRMRATGLGLLALSVAAPALGGEVAGGASGGLWQIPAAFAAGIFLSLTPCVYPMIFITAAVVGGRGQKGKLAAFAGAVTYVLGLSLVYALVGLLVATAGSQVRVYLDSPWMRIPVAVIFLTLALSMFDLFQIGFGEGLAARLKSSLSGRMGLLGIFLMGAVSAIAAGPCLSAPLAGILIKIAETGDTVLGFFTLFALAWGMGIVMIVAGTFTGALPRAGEWMDGVKKLMGFLMIWAGIYFIQPIIGFDLYYIATGIVLVAGGVYLGGLYRLDAESSGKARLKAAAGVLVIICGGALVLMGAGLIGGEAPPVAVVGGGETLWKEAVGPDVDAALASGRPVVLDFHSANCVYCVKLDRETLRHPDVVAELDGFVTLKVDTTKLPGLAARFKLVGTPTVIFFDASGGEVHRIMNFAPSGEFIDHIRKAK